jgi:superfamily II DNA or RNA helicase
MINDRKGRAQAFHQCEITPEATTFAPLAGLVMNSNERGLILERFGEGEIEVLCCVQLLTEGFDLPGIGAILLARPTMSTLLLMQMIGRGRRGPAVGGLPEVKIVDFADQVEIHTDRHDAEHRHVARFEDAERAWRSRTVSGEDAREGE